VKRTDRRSDCPVNFALQSFGDSWSLLIVRDLVFSRRRTFAEFAASGEGIATNVLAARLKSLARARIIRRVGKGRQVHYALTPKGIDLVPMLLEMIRWSALHARRTAVTPAFAARLEGERERIAAELRARLEAPSPRPMATSAPTSPPRR
jgi:DNA-binding HxlR family transcriptional regulator